MMVDIDPELRWFIKSLAVERRITLKQWVREAIVEKVAKSYKKKED